MTQTVEQQAKRIVNKHMQKVIILRIISIILVTIWIIAYAFLIIDWITARSFQLLTAVIIIFSLTSRTLKYISILRIENILQDRCDADLYTEVMRLLLKKDDSKRGTRILTIKKAKGLYFMGEFDEAYKLLQTVQLSNKKFHSTLEYYNILANCAKQRKNLDELRRIFELIKLLTLNTKDGSQKRVTAEEILQIITANIELLQEEYQKSRESTLNMKIETSLQKISYYSRLMLLAAKFGEESSAKSYAEYVVKYGNRTYFVAEAKTFLEGLAK
ncbi:hypothetical protein IA817_12585 [Listeria seeligeri]|uniref:hypothetical protein n=1 Tax=Listeria seeligeri TaxID=1640 RepID=UPI001886D7EF|nr:hypothetical protein [Listeria seeligeri]MBF2482145.1 hypothetical protein [Listeria seeligeri]